MCDHAVIVDGRAKVFLGGPPLVKMATGEDSDDESLGGAAMHSRVSGLSDYFAVDEHDCIRIGREIVADLNWRKLGPGPDRPADPPRYDPDELLGIASADLRVPFDPLDVIARIVDGSRFDEYKPRLRHEPRHRLGVDPRLSRSASSPTPAACCSWTRRRRRPSSSCSPTRPTCRCCSCRTAPATWWARTTSRPGIIKDGAKMINAVTNSTVPHLTVIMGASYGAGNYGMCGRAYGPRFLFAWPNSKMAVMGPQQLAGVLSIVARQSAESQGKPFDEEADAGAAQAVEEQIERSRTRSSTAARSTTTASSTRATPGPCSASRCRPSTPMWSKAAGASASSGCEP